MCACQAPLIRAHTPKLARLVLRASAGPQAYNSSGGLSELEQARRLELLQDLLGSVNTEQRPFIEPTFACDYGYNIHLGKDVYVNFGAIFLDCNTITIGAHDGGTTTGDFACHSHAHASVTRSRGADSGFCTR